MRKNSAFTLVELLTVIAVIGILAAISFGIATGVAERQARTRAAAELAALSAALESYRVQYGMYPPTDEPEELLSALANRLKWTRDAETGELEEEELSERRSFIDPSKFDVQEFDDEDEFGEPNSGQVLLDPWGNEYYYEYRTDKAWKRNRFGFVLFSMGPDEEMVPPEDGIIDDKEDDNADNIYP